jgi:hypothetical protein
MKKLIALGALMLGMAVSYAQGQVNFNNKVGASGVNARVLDPTGTPAASPPYAAGLAVDAGGIWTYIPASATTLGRVQPRQPATSVLWLSLFLVMTSALPSLLLCLATLVLLRIPLPQRPLLEIATCFLGHLTL